jgi:uncharacterized protein YcgI (DUF1989 family)
MVDTVTEIVVAGGHGAAFSAKTGDLIEIVDVRGQQAVDFVAFAADDLTETLSGVETRRALLSLYIKVGDTLISSRRRPMLRVVSDTIGIHDYTVPACDSTRFAVDFGVPGHRNCLHNMFHSLEVFGVRSPLDVPEPFNLFQNSPVIEDGRTGVVDSTSRPGDTIALSPLIDIVCGVSSCPQDIIPGNGLAPSEIQVRVIRGQA